MGISNLSSGFRPGVCTSTTRPSAPFEGQMIYETDTNRVLVWDNAAWVMIADTDQPPGLQLVNTTTLSADTTKQIDNCFTTDFVNYLIVGNLTSSADATLIYKLVDGTTPNSANNTTMTGYYLSWANGNYNANSSGGAIAYGFVAYIDATMGGNFSMVVYRPQEASRTMSISDYVDGDWNGRMNNRHDVATEYEGIQFGTSTGTPTLTGTIRVYGYRN